MIAIVVIFLILSATANSLQYFLTVDELLAKKEEYIDKQIRISGAVVGESIHFDADTLELTFVIAHVSAEQAEIEEQGGLAESLHQAVIDPMRSRIEVVYLGIKPDLLLNESQAIITGILGEDGTFQAEEILLKCPSRYAEQLPEQIEETP